MRTYEQSIALYERARKVTPAGAQTMSKAPGRVGPIGAYPLYLRSAKGGYVEDVDGHRYVDWFGGNCAVTLGHGYGPVLEAINDALHRYGSLPSLPTELEAHVAERLCALIPCAEQVRFLKTGSEATEAAVRIARTATGKEKIVVFRGHYHGWHSQWQVVKPEHPGVPGGFWRYLGEATSLSDLYGAMCMQYDGGPLVNTAAIILEPCLLEPTSKEYLQSIIDLAHAHGALVIFDEMITGVRWGLGGYQQHIGVTPDLATFGKAYANGHPLAFVCGRADLMQRASLVSGTFGGEVAGLAACNAVLRAYQSWDRGGFSCDGDHGALASLQRAGHLVRAQLDGLHLPMSVIGSDVRFACQWDADLPNRDEVIALWQQELAEHGVLVHPLSWNPSAAHDAQSLLITAEAINAAADTIRLAMLTDTVVSRLRGPVLTAAFARPVA